MSDGFLARMTAAVRDDVRAGHYSTPSTPQEPRRPPSLRRAIERGRSVGSLVVEFKRRSPGQSDPELPGRSPTRYVGATTAANVAGYSCLATRAEFGGSVADVAEMVRSSDVPVLFKDFVVEPAQLDAAARVGASAVLLIARLETAGLLSTPLATLAGEAHDRGLEVLLEFHSKSELSHAAGVPADMYGVNMRDLDTLRMEAAVAAETVGAARELRPLLWLSGISSSADAARAWDLGVDGLLVGSAVARAPDPAVFLASLHREEAAR